MRSAHGHEQARDGPPRRTGAKRRESEGKGREFGSLAPTRDCAMTRTKPLVFERRSNELTIYRKRHHRASLVAVVLCCMSHMTCAGGPATEGPRKLGELASDVHSALGDGVYEEHARILKLCQSWGGDFVR